MREKEEITKEEIYCDKCKRRINEYISCKCVKCKKDICCNCGLALVDQRWKRDNSYSRTSKKKGIICIDCINKMGFIFT